jgi:hypothetical protein
MGRKKASAMELLRVRRKRGGIGQCRSGFFVHAAWSAVSSGTSLRVEIPFRRSPARTLRRDIARRDSGSSHRAMRGHQAAPAQNRKSIPIRKNKGFRKYVTGHRE